MKQAFACVSCICMYACQVCICMYACQVCISGSEKRKRSGSSKMKSSKGKRVIDEG